MGKLQIKSAARRNKNLHDASSWHCTTFESGDVRPTYYRPLLATDRVDVNISNQVRLAPLEVPTFGDFKLRHSAYFVPYNVVWKYYDDFKRDNRGAIFSIDSTLPVIPGWSDAEMSKPRVLREEFVNILQSRGYIELLNSPSTSLPSLADGSDFIFSVWDRGEGNLFFQAKFTAKGRKLKAILDALGYRFPFSANIRYSYGSAENFASNAEFLDLLPLLQYARVFYDHIYESHFLDDLDVSFFTDPTIWCGLNYLFVTYSYSWFSGALPLWEAASDDPFFPDGRAGMPYRLLGDFIDKVVELSSSWWSHSIFTDAWLSPNSRNGQSYGNSKDLVGPDTREVRPNNLTVVANGEDNGFNAWMLRAVQNLADFTTRYNIGGARLHDWLQQNFGIVTRMQDADMSIFVKTLTQNVTIQDVTQTSESTDNSLLGELAGKGYSFGQNGFSFECDRDGAIIVITELVPEIHYVEGSAYWASDSVKPSWYNLYQPAFDNLGFVAMPLREVKSNYLRPSQWSKTGQVFRYVPSYAQHKVRYDVLSGMFTLHSQNAGFGSASVPAGQLGCYHSGRMFGDDWNQDRGLSFNKQDQQMDRVFALAPTDSQGRQIYDHFYCLFQFNVKRWSSMKTIGESIPFFDRSGDTITVDYNGNI